MPTSFMVSLASRNPSANAITFAPLSVNISPIAFSSSIVAVNSDGMGTKLKPETEAATLATDRPNDSNANATLVEMIRDVRTHS